MAALDEGTDGMIDVGGLMLHVHCLGEGAPLVVLDTGLGGDGAFWKKQRPIVRGMPRGLVSVGTTVGAAWPRLRSGALQESQIERPEHQDDADVHHQPLPYPVPEEQDVDADHDSYQREHIERDGGLLAHPSFLPADGARVYGTS